MKKKKHKIMIIDLLPNNFLTKILWKFLKIRFVTKIVPMAPSIITGYKAKIIICDEWGDFDGSKIRRKDKLL